jgi:hypothetical protein
MARTLSTQLLRGAAVTIAFGLSASIAQLKINGTRTGTATQIELDGRFTTTLVGSAFSFNLSYLPTDCMVDLRSIGGTGGALNSVVIANCGPRGLNPKGAWLNTTTYVENDVVVDLGSSWRAKASAGVNLAKRPLNNLTLWEQLAAKGDRGPQGIKGTSRVDGTNWADGPDRVCGSQRRDRRHRPSRTNPI